MEIVQDGNTNYYLNQTESTNLVEEYTEFFPIEFQKKSKVALRNTFIRGSLLYYLQKLQKHGELTVF